jgi:hypothetical protein
LFDYYYTNTPPLLTKNFQLDFIFDEHLHTLPKIQFGIGIETQGTIGIQQSADHHLHSISELYQATLQRCARKPPATHAVRLSSFPTPNLRLRCLTFITNPANTSTDKTTWWGCGKHVPGVMESIPSEQWCTCAPRVEREGHQYPPMGSLASA